MSNRIIVLGDLHYEPEDDFLYRKSLYQIKACKPKTCISLGDLGGYSHCGTWESFDEGYHYLSDIGVPFYPVVGNHDMESKEFKTDKAALAAWMHTFELEKPYFSVNLGNALGICLSNTHFRSAPFCAHEVALDQAQIEWFKETLLKNRDKPTFVFTHVPILGSGIRVIASIHLRGPNAYLNHTSNPQQFIQIVKDNPQIKLWFSAHNHLGHDYPDTISTVGKCSFVHVGTMAKVSRDGNFHSRIIDFDGDSIQIKTLDHITGKTTLNLTRDLEATTIDQAPATSAPLTDGFIIAPSLENNEPSFVINNSAFLIHKNLLIEYDYALRAPIGVVYEKMDNKTAQADGERIVIKCEEAEPVYIEPNPALNGHYFKVMVPNQFSKR